MSFKNQKCGNQRLDDYRRQSVNCALYRCCCWPEISHSRSFCHQVTKLTLCTKEQAERVFGKNQHYFSHWRCLINQCLSEFPWFLLHSSHLGPSSHMLQSITNPKGSNHIRSQETYGQNSLRNWRRWKRRGYDPSRWHRCGYCGKRR